ncbi:MAG: outer membrane beta-barrel protein [Chitinophagaceae bacterium]
MEDNDFENQVHLKMSSMQLSPSASVWKKVDERLHPEKNRRRYIIWSMFLLAGLTVCAYLFKNLFTPTNERSISLVTKNSKLLPADSAKSARNNKNGLNKQPTITPAPKASRDADATSTMNMTSLDKKEVGFTDRQSLNRKRNKSRNPLNTSDVTLAPGNSSKKPSSKKYSIGMAYADKSHLKKRSRETGEVGTRQNENIKENANGIVMAPTEAIDSQNQLKQTVFRNPEPGLVNASIIDGKSINTSMILITTMPQTALSTIKLRQLHHMSWGILFLGGRSPVSNGSILSLAQSSQPSNNFNSASSPGTTFAPVPSALKAGSSFGIGLFIRRPLSLRFSVSAGLNYALYSLSNKLGQKIDSAIILTPPSSADRMAVQQYFRTGLIQTYVSRYHFIELPILLHAKLNADERMPVSLDLGFTVSRLILNNAVHYDASSGIYYKNNSLLNKTQVNLVTGLPIRIYSTRQFSFDVGPHAKYGITNLVSKQQSAPMHLFFVGIKGGILFKKN